MTEPAAPPPASGVPVAFPNMTGHGDLVAVPAGLLSGNPAHWKMRCVDCGKEHQAALATPPASPAEPVYTIAHDGFTGTLQGRYVTREGKRGIIRHYADLLARVARERDALQASLDAMHGRPFSERVYAALKSRAETAEQRAEVAEKERDEAHRAYSEGVREFYARVEREITNEALRRAAEAARQWGDEQVRKWADDDKMCEDAKSRAWDVHVVARKIEALIKEPGHE